MTWDERFTSSLALQTLHTMGVKQKDRRRKGKIDSMAAAILLQSFLDSTKRSLSC
ncbi:MAG: Holliday junction resolvase RuvX [Bacteroidota bacterium]